MKIIQTVPTVYPRDVNYLGITEGHARVAVQIDDQGKLTDYLVTAYSHPRFADAAVAAIKKWRYEPAIINGKPSGATSELTFTFESRGLVVVDLTVTSYVELRNYQLQPEAYAYSAHRLSELDRIPTPTKVVQPVYPLDASNQRRPAVVTVYFYIDEQGRVRLPAVDRMTSETDSAFAVAALNAVAQWKFEPPLSKGVPVLVAARQDFKFNPGTAK